MSWDSYRDTLIASGHVHHAAIFGLQGGAWTQSPGLNITDAEIKAIVAGLSNASSFQANGVLVGGNKYMYLQSDDGQVQAKKGATGVSIAKAGTCLVISIYKDGQVPGNCRTQAERIRDYLVNSGY